MTHIVCMSADSIDDDGKTELKKKQIEINDDESKAERDKNNELFLECGDEKVCLVWCGRSRQLGLLRDLASFFCRK